MSISKFDMFSIKKKEENEMKRIEDLSKWSLFADEKKFDLWKFSQLKIIRNDQMAQPKQRKAFSPKPRTRLFLWIESWEESFDEKLSEETKNHKL